MMWTLLTILLWFLTHEVVATTTTNSASVSDRELRPITQTSDDPHNNMGDGKQKASKKGKHDHHHNHHPSRPRVDETDNNNGKGGNKKSKNHHPRTPTGNPIPRPSSPPKTSLDNEGKGVIRPSKLNPKSPSPPNVQGLPDKGKGIATTTRFPTDVPKSDSSSLAPTKSFAGSATKTNSPTDVPKSISSSSSLAPTKIFEDGSPTKTKIPKSVSSSSSLAPTKTFKGGAMTKTNSPTDVPKSVSSSSLAPTRTFKGGGPTKTKFPKSVSSSLAPTKTFEGGATTKTNSPTDDPTFLPPTRTFAPSLTPPASGARGYTWTLLEHLTSYGGVDRVGCAECNAYSGDTSCSKSLPMLCLIQDSPTTPSGLYTDFYNGWAGGHIATTVPIKGSTLTSLIVADQTCATSFGDGWRMAEHHDGDGGWNWFAYGQVPNNTRFWVYINDQPANCWNN